MLFFMDRLINIIKENYKTLITVNKGGDLLDFYPFKIDPTLEEEYKVLKELSEKYKGCCSTFLFQDKNITEEKINKKILELVEAIKYAKTHKLGSGINIPKKENLN